MSSQMQYVQLIMDKTNAADLWSGVFTVLISITWMIKEIQNSLPFHKICLANSDMTKEALYCIASL